ncbi:MAG: hypothetical protein GY821_14280 [Gammaproteobacteria bacterium]|nr:hypothetical protein [Gammaproteobacteria bacterium]
MKGKKQIIKSSDKLITETKQEVAKANKQAIEQHKCAEAASTSKVLPVQKQT